MIKGEADAIKGGFQSHDEAKASASFKVIYPETLFKETQKPAEAVTGGIVFTAPFSSSDAFIGNTEYSSKSQMLSALAHNRDQHQSATVCRVLNS